MNKNEENKLIDVMIDLAQEMKGLRKDMNHRFEKMEREQHKTNILLAEHSRSILTLADKLKVVVDHERRILRLERAA